MFSGWSEGFHTLAPITENYLTEVPIIGPLHRYNTYSGGIYRNISTRTGSITTGDVLRLALEEVGFQGDTDITAVRTKLYNWKLNADGIFGQVDDPTSLLEVCKSLAQAELGRIYDDYSGRIVFEGRQERGELALPGNLFVIEANSELAIINVAMTKIGNSIINSVVSEQDSYRSPGNRRCKSCWVTYYYI